MCTDLSKYSNEVLQILYFYWINPIAIIEPLNYNGIEGQYEVDLYLNFFALDETLIKTNILSIVIPTGQKHLVKEELMDETTK